MAYILYYIAFLFFISIGTLFSQEIRWDYSYRPNFSLDILSLRLNVQLKKTPWNIQGTVTYSARSKISNLSSIRLDIGDMEVSHVRYEGQFLYIRQEEGSLYITFPNDIDKGEIFDFQITYSSSLRYGLFETSDNILVSSALPLGVHYWIPGLDHPSIQMPVEAIWTVPSDMNLVTIGHLIETKKQDDEFTRYHFRTDEKIPFSSLWFIAGDIIIQSIELKEHHIQWIMSKKLENFILPVVQEKTEQVLDIIRSIERKTQKKLPYLPLSVVVFNAPQGDLYHYSAGLVRLYSINGTNSLNMLKKGIAAQWGGVYIRSQQWQHQKEIHRLRDMLFVSSMEQRNLNSYNPYHFSYNPYPKDDDSLPKIDSLIAREIPSLFTSSVALESGELDQLFYRKTGIFTKWFSDSSIFLPQNIVQYDASIHYQMNRGKVRVVIKKKEGGLSYNGEQSLQLVAQFGSRPYQITESITLKGEEKDITMNVGNNLESFYILYDNPNIHIDENKDDSFWLYQLQSPYQSARLESAKKLSSMSPPIDAQLFLIDALRQEPNSSIRAEIYKTLSIWLDARSGTENIFLEGLNDHSKEVTLVVLDALSRYAPKDYIKQEIGNWFNHYDGSIENHFLFKKAIDIYAKNSSDDELFYILDQHSHRWHSMIQWYILKKINLHVKSTRLKSWFHRLIYDDNNPYVRSQAIQRLGLYVQKDLSLSLTNEEIIQLFETRNGIIRKAAVQFCQLIRSDVCINLLKKQKEIEADPRVLSLLIGDL